MGRSQKGGQFEREFCRELSKWWMEDEDQDDVFWRSQTSGARATQRAKQGKKTHGQYGDIAYTNAVGKSLLDFITIELKCGYSKFNIHDLLDRPKKAAIQKLEGWIIKAIRDAEESGSKSWMIVWKRDRRETLVITPQDNLARLRWTGFPYPCILASLRVRFGEGKNKKTNRVDIMVTTLKRWFSLTNPKKIRRRFEKQV